MNNLVPKKENICAIIVTYYPDANFPDRIANIAKQVDRMIIIDNSSSNSDVIMLQRLSRRLNIHLILNADNLSVATALNQGMAEAKKQGYAWALLFDQDTDPIDSMVELMINAYNNFPQKDSLAVIGSNYYNATTHKTRFEFKNTSGWAEQKTVITSGSLVSLTAFEFIGCFRDEFFIDHVDDEYCLRARAKGLKIIMTLKPVMTHALGDVKMHKLLWRTTGTSNHSALRRYYMTRNHIILAREYIFSEPSWVLATLHSRFKSIILLILFEKDRGTKLRNVILGIWHGILGKIGKYESSH